jgi:hypothetical protein
VLPQVAEALAPVLVLDQVLEGTDNLFVPNILFCVNIFVTGAQLHAHQLVPVVDFALGLLMTHLDCKCKPFTLYITFTLVTL